MSGFRKAGKPSLIPLNGRTRSPFLQGSTPVASSGRTLKFPVSCSAQRIRGEATREESGAAGRQNGPSATDQAEAVLGALTVGVVTIGLDEEILSLNPAACALTGRTVQEAVGAHCSTLFATDSPVLANNSAAFRTIITNARTGAQCCVEATVCPILEADLAINAYAITLHDVTRSYEPEERLHWQASHHALTGLVNRAALEARAAAARARLEQTGGEGWILYIDLDPLKLVNDTCGEAAGDALLREAALLVGASLPGRAILARLGADGFGVLAERATEAQAVQLAAQIRKALCDFRFTDRQTGRAFSIRASVGIAGFSAGTARIADVIAHAHAACNAARESAGGVRVHREAPPAQPAHCSEMEWASRIQRIMEAGRFTLHRQAIVPTTWRAGSSRHYELLLRAVDDDGSIVAPMSFIPAAERYGAMSLIDRYIVSAALPAIAAEHLAESDVYAINLSGQSLSSPAFRQFIRKAIESSGVNPHDVCFEITETAALSNVASVGAFVRELALLGVRFSLDDFGTGFSSFAYLKDLHVDYLKIDGSFIENLADDAIKVAMVKSMVSIGHALGSRTIAEFVDSASTLAVLRELGCDYAQGFYLHEPEMHIAGAGVLPTRRSLC